MGSPPFPIASTLTGTGTGIRLFLCLVGFSARYTLAAGLGLGLGGVSVHCTLAAQPPGTATISNIAERRDVDGQSAQLHGTTPHQATEKSVQAGSSYSTSC
jgi:hypothetical protein